MSPQPTQAVLSPAGARLLFSSLVHFPGTSPQQVTQARQAALEWLAEMAPRDRLESALAVRVIALHEASIHHMAHAMAAERSPDLMMRHGGRGMAAAKLMDWTSERLRVRQAGPARKAVALPAEIVAMAAEAHVPVPEGAAPKAAAVTAPPKVPDTLTEIAPPRAPVATAPAAPTPAATAPVTTTPAATTPAAPTPAKPAPATPAPAVTEADAPLLLQPRRARALEGRLAAGEELTETQMEWLRRQLAARTETSAQALTVAA